MKKLNTKELVKLLKGKTVKEVVKEVCGEMIGRGAHRDVYVLKSNSDYVVKIERDMRQANFANATEWRHYIDNQYWKWLEVWLAPCMLISETSQVLIQQRVSWEGKRRKDYPARIPNLFEDLKLKNFGWIGDRFVCCDYSFLSIPSPTKGSDGMKRAYWWGSLKPKKNVKK